MSPRSKQNHARCGNELWVVGRVVRCVGEGKTALTNSQRTHTTRLTTHNTPSQPTTLTMLLHKELNLNVK